MSQQMTTASAVGAVLPPIAPTLGHLGVAFVVLKLLGFLAWPWWQVLLPFYGGLGILAVVWVATAVFYIGLGILSHLAMMYEAKQKKKHLGSFKLQA